MEVMVGNSPQWMTKVRCGAQWVNKQNSFIRSDLMVGTWIFKALLFVDIIVLKKVIQERIIMVDMQIKTTLPVKVDTLTVYEKCLQAEKVVNLITLK